MILECIEKGVAHRTREMSTEKAPYWNAVSRPGVRLSRWEISFDMRFKELSPSLLKKRVRRN